ncbi:MAG: hypothetical protein LBQ04_01415 [Endomicrobium sp.]|jgi:NTP pyrophosphatase (non-canonical NTP hydrolase)|nr:hypothetical protein [Endomicrobium sp.]
MKWIIKEQYSQNEKAAADVLREYLNIVLVEDIRMKLGIRTVFTALLI